MAGIRGATGWIGVNLACTDPLALATFYADLFGWEVSSSEPTYATVLIRDPSGSATHSNLAFELDRHYRRPVWPSEPNGQQQMVHLDIGVTDVVAAVEDAVGLGARLADFQPQDDVRVMLDPEGHPFCLYLDQPES
ncbi:VOC family protein [Nocardioides sp. NPDC006303]|uniref:VOC family protein n=1 Tax=Nocardioides sp. NPDC006303 TaxID=3156747 RepID=UPI0033A58076